MTLDLAVPLSFSALHFRTQEFVCPPRRLFDRLILLSEGRVAYMGALKSAAPFFESIGHPCPAFFNPADHFIHKLSMTPRQEEEYLERTETICRQFAESEHGAALSAELRSHVEDREGRFDNAGFELSSLRPYKSPWLQQFGAVLWRSWHSVSKDPIIARIRIVEAVGLALLVGTIYFGQGPDYDQAATASVSGALFWATTNQAFLNYGAVLGVRKRSLAVLILAVTNITSHHGLPTLASNLTFFRHFASRFRCSSASTARAPTAPTSTS